MKRIVELVFFIAGLVGMVIGLAQVYRPAAWIGGGALMITLALVSRRTE